VTAGDIKIASVAGKWFDEKRPLCRPAAAARTYTSQGNKSNRTIFKFMSSLENPICEAALGVVPRGDEDQNRKQGRGLAVGMRH